MANLKVVEADAGVPTAFAVIVAVVSGVTADGTPTNWTVFDDIFDNESPVPVRLVVLKVTGFPDAAVALN